MNPILGCRSSKRLVTVQRSLLSLGLAGTLAYSLQPARADAFPANALTAAETRKDPSTC
jgi:hypothetical protein